LLLAVVPASARAKEEGQLLTIAVASGPVIGDLALLGIAEARVGDDFPRLIQTEIGAGIGWEGSRHAIYGAYVLTTMYRPGGSEREHRLWQRVAYPLGTAGSIRLTGRTMIEERMFEGRRGIFWRLQQQLRATLPVSRSGRIRLVAQGDVAINLNDLGRGGGAGIDQLRLFGGANLRLGRRQSVELGYLHQHIRRVGGPDRILHVVSVAMIHRFK
jgi:hypothetical protein